MTTRLKGLTVAFDSDIREDDAVAIVTAIRMLRGVGDVKPIEASGEDWIVESRVRRDLEARLWEVLHPKRPIG